MGETIHCRALALLPILPAALRPCILALFLATIAGCGRAHDLQEGPYVFTITPSDVFRDDCGLATDGGPVLQAQFQAYGNDVRLAMVQQSSTRCLDVELVGQYQYDNQNFFADGSASNPLLEASGQLCQVDFAQYHLDAVTVDPVNFNGVMRISYLGSSPVACNCQFWFNYRATLCTAPNCPPVPTQCT